LSVLIDPLKGLGKNRQYITLGIEIMTALMVPMGVGFWIDSIYDTTPWGLICGVLLGFAVVMTLLVKTVREN